MLNQKHVRRRFERAAKTFDDCDFAHAVTRDGLLTRIEPLLIDASTVVDLGAATGSSQRALAKRFRGAQIISIDFAAAMLRQARRKKPWFAKNAYLQASADAIPLADQSVDVVFANMLLPWSSNPDPIFGEVARVLKKGGVFAFASLGPDSLQALQAAWREVDDQPHVNPFADMHDLGDGLVRAGLADPVLDVDQLTISYSSAKQLFADLTGSGARNSLSARRPGLTSRGQYQVLIDALQGRATDGKMEDGLELVYGHCWGAGPKMDASHFQFDAHKIPLRRQ